MVIYDSRKKQLVEEYGEDGCMKSDSWFRATFNDLTNQLRLYIDDVAFMYREGSNYCVPGTTPEEETPTKLIVREYNNLSATIKINGAVVGQTNTFIEIEPGDYTATIEKEGYETETIALVVKEGQTNEYKYVKLVATQTPPGETTPPDEYETPGAIGPVLTSTGNAVTPNPIKTGENNWFGWEFKNTGDATWRGIVGIKLVGSKGETWQWDGDTTKKQTIASGETKYVWAYVKVDSLPGTGEVKIYALMTKTG